MAKDVYVVCGGLKPIKTDTFTKAPNGKPTAESKKSTAKGKNANGKK